MASQRSSKGMCAICGGHFSKSAMSRHLQSCRQKADDAKESVGRRARRIKSFHVVVEGRHAPAYWMHLEAPANATLDDLDSLLRDEWLECCGHISAFDIGDIEYSSAGAVADPWGMQTESMDTTLAEVLSTGTAFRYVYDFGSSTELALRVVSEHDVTAGRKPAIELSARNDAPEWHCSVCGKPAVSLCTECGWQHESFLCVRCASEHECGEEMLLPVVNSPRMGVCGYTGK